MLKIPNTATIACFCIGLASSYSFNVIGQLYVADVLIICCFAAFLLLSPMKANFEIFGRVSLIILSLAAVWLLGQIVTDFLVNSPFQNYMRGWAKIVFFAIAFIALGRLSEFKPDRLVAYFVGIGIARIISTAFFPDTYAVDEPWKFGYSMPISILSLCAVIYVPKKVRYLTSMIVCAVLAGVNLSLNFRSMFLFLCATMGILTAQQAYIAIWPHRKIISAQFLIALTVLGAVGGVGTKVLYESMASSGAIGEKAKTKYDDAAQGDLGILLGGRSESLVSLKAIKDSPVIGHGSWAEDHKYVAMQIQLLREHGVDAQAQNIRSDLIPTHSYLLGAWVEAGILGAVFWVFAFGLAVAGLLAALDARSQFTPLVLFLGLNFLWDVPFSPFGADSRFIAAGVLAIIVWALRQKPQFALSAPHKIKRRRSKLPKKVVR